MPETELVHTLYMEGDAGLANACRKRLEQTGFIVDLAADGEEVLAMCTSNSYDVVVVDYAMTGNDGLDVIRILASRGPLPPTVIIADPGSEQVIAEAMELGADDYVIKDADGEFLGLIPSIIWGVFHRQCLVEKQRQVEEVLWDNEEGHRAILDTLQDGYFEVDLAGNFTFLSNSLCRMLGYSRDELLGTGSRQHMDEENAKKVYQVFNRVLASGDPAKIQDFECIRKDATTMNLEISVSLIRNLESEPVGFRGIGRDITECKLQEEKINRLVSAIYISTDSITISDVFGDILDVNDASLEFYGAEKKEDLIGKNIFDLLPLKAQNKDGGLLSEFLEKGYTKDQEIETVIKDGSFRTLQISVSLLPDTNGEPIGLVGITRDISKRVQAEKALRQAHDELEHRVKERTADLLDINERLSEVIFERAQAEVGLRESELRFRNVATMAADAIILANNEEKINFCNRTAQNIFGYCEEDMLGKPLSMLMLERHVGDYERLIERLRFSSEDVSVATRTGAYGIGKNGRVFPIELATSSWKSGEERYFCATIRDMSEVQEAQKRAQLQDRLAAVGQLASGIAHDFNNMLAPIMLYSEMVSDDPNLKPENKDRLLIIWEQSRRAATLVQQILDFSRHGIIEPRPFDLLEFLNKLLINLLERTFPANILLYLEHGPEEYIVGADLGRMQQVFLNLAFNARDAMPDGGKLWLELSRLYVESDAEAPFRDMPSGDWVQVRVSDTGSGIPPDALPHVFEPFFTTKPVGEGTGLGLSQVYGIIKQHGGYIDVESKLGEGTVFIIYLPLIKRTTESAQTLCDEDTVRGNGETILLVEDESVVRDVISEALLSVNYRVNTVANGHEALDIIDQHKYDIDLVISDMVMPKMGGLELFRALQEKRPEVKMIMITGYPLGIGTRELLDRGKVAWLQKPMDKKTLLQTVHALLDENESQSMREDS